MCRVDKRTGRINGEAIELEGDLLQDRNRGVWGNRLQKTVGLDVERSEDRGEEACLLRRPIISDLVHLLQDVTYIDEEIINLSIPSLDHLIAIVLYYLGRVQPRIVLLDIGIGFTELFSQFLSPAVSVSICTKRIVSSPLGTEVQKRRMRPPCRCPLGPAKWSRIAGTDALCNAQMIRTASRASP